MPSISTKSRAARQSSLIASTTLCKIIFTILTVTGAYSASAAEISLGNGFYRSETFAGDYSKSRIGLGGQYSKQFHPVMYWQAGGDLAIVTQSAHAYIAASSLTGFRVNGGVRYYFDRLSQSFAPFVVGRLSLENDWGDVLVNPVQVEIKSSSGIFYGATVGLRMTLSSDFFLDISSELFKSPLFATETTKTKMENSTNEVKTKSTSLYVNTRSSLSDLEIAVGMRL